MSVNWTDISSRVKQIRVDKGLTQQAFAEIIGMSRSAYAQVETGAINIGLEYLDKVCSHFATDLNWLVRGVVSDTNNTSSLPSLSVVSNTVKPLPVVVDNIGKERITLVDVKASAGYPAHLTEPKYFKNLPTFSLPGVEFQQATFRCFEVAGDSMERTIHHGDWIIAQYLDNFTTGIREGYVHVVITKEDVFVKRLLNRIVQRGKVTLLSDNKYYPPIEIPVEDIQEIWSAKRKISALFIDPDRDLQTQVNHLITDFVDLKARIEALEVKRKN